MKKISIMLLLFILFSLCACGNEVFYTTPEEYCRAIACENYQIVLGKDSVLIVYEKSPGKVELTFLKKAENGFLPIAYHMILKEFFGPCFATIYKGNGVDDTYILLVLSGNDIAKEIEDEKGSTFYYLSAFASTDEKMEIGRFASAYIGAESEDYYKNNYWYKVNCSS